MRSRVDERYLRERDRFALHASCEACHHFADAAEVCVLTFPSAPHRQALAAALAPGAGMFFCKSFELRADDTEPADPCPRGR